MESYDTLRPVEFGKMDERRFQSSNVRGGQHTFAVVGEVEQQGLEAAGVGSELVPDDFAEQDHGDVVLHLRTTRMSYDEPNPFRAGWCSTVPYFYLEAKCSEQIFTFLKYIGFFSLSYTQNIQARGDRIYPDQSESC